MRREGARGTPSPAAGSRSARTRTTPITAAGWCSPLDRSMSGGLDVAPNRRRDGWRRRRRRWIDGERGSVANLAILDSARNERGMCREPAHGRRDIGSRGELGDEELDLALDLWTARASSA